MKNINDNQLNAILQLLAKYNVGIQDYSAVEKMFNELSTNENKMEETKVVETPVDEVVETPTDEVVV